MEKYIKYKRISTSILDTEENIQTFLDGLIKDGLEIIYWDEKRSGSFNPVTEHIDYYIDITTLLGKKQSNIL